MPFVDAAGGLSKFLYLNSQEPEGKFPQIITPVIPENIKVYPGTTAMMTTNDLEIFLELLIGDLISRNIPKALLLADSWSSNKDNKIFKKLQEKYKDIQLERLLIPEGTTGMIKPLDVFYFRPYKQFVRHISDSIEISEKFGGGTTTSSCKLWPTTNSKLPCFVT